MCTRIYAYDKNKKNGNKEYGDYINWKEIIKKAKQDNKNILFITSEKKEDWFLIKGGELVKPRPELITEFHNDTDKLIYIYRTDIFFMKAKEVYKINTIDESVIEEIKESNKDRSKYEDEIITKIKYLSKLEEFIRLKDLDKQDEFNKSGYLNVNNKFILQLKHLDKKSEQWLNKLNDLRENGELTEEEKSYIYFKLDSINDDKIDIYNKMKGIIERDNLE